MRWIPAGLVLLMLGSGIADAQQPPATGEAGGVSVEVARKDGNRLRVHIRLEGSARLESIRGRIDGKPLTETAVVPYPYPDAISSIVFVIDNGSTMSPAAIEHSKQIVAGMLDAARPYHRFGLGIVGRDLRMRVPPGSQAEQVRTALAGIPVLGSRLELYRSLMSAVLQAGMARSTRRAIFLFSGGLSEDTAYRLDDVVTAAKIADVAIHAYGLPTDPPQPAGMQALARLAQGTGGRFFQADDNLVLPARATTDPFAAVDNGGSATFTLTPEQFAAGGKVAFAVTTSAGTENVETSLPALPSSQSAASMPASVRGWALWVRDPVMQAGAFLAVVFVGGMIAILIAHRRARRVKFLQRLVEGHFDEPDAWLEFLEGGGQPVGVTGTTFRIGRNRDNNLVLNSAAVSGQHAVISRARDGSYSIDDLGSPAGMAVNLSTVRSASLNNGDLIELGDVRLRFRTVARSLPPIEDGAASTGMS